MVVFHSSRVLFEKEIQGICWYNGRWAITSLLETLEEEAEDDNKVVFEEENLIPVEEAEI